MAIVYKTVDEVAADYLTNLKGAKPNANINQEDNDWWIKSRVLGGAMSGVYSDQRKIGEDAFPQNARREAVLAHLFTHLGETEFRPATQSQGTVTFTGDPGTIIPIGQQAEYSANGNLYTVVLSAPVVVPSGGSVGITVQSVAVGQSQNLTNGAVLTVNSPPAGLDNTATAVDGIRDGTNEETEAAAAKRVLAFIQSRERGGTQADYIKYAFDAAPSVTDANPIRFMFGLGTVGLVIASGTTDIDAALDAGDPITFAPSPELVTTVQDYLKTKVPETDCPTALGVTEVAVNATIKVEFISGDASTILDGETLTQGELVEREVKRAIYKTGAGGRKPLGPNTQGYVLASEIEAMIDKGLSYGPIVVGDRFQIVTNRQCLDLDVSGPDKPIGAAQIAIPGTITIEAF